MGIFMKIFLPLGLQIARRCLEVRIPLSDGVFVWGGGDVMQ